MRIWCRYSGVEFSTSDFKNLKATGEHPLILVPTHTLLSKAGEWAAGGLTEKETVALFVALLKSTDLVDFKTTAAPSYETCQKYMEFLLRTIGWKETLSDQIFLKLPRFVINHSTKTLTNVHHWLATWEEIKSNWAQNVSRAYKAKDILDKLVRREEALARLIKSHTKKSSDYAWLLAKWAMLAGEVPKGLQEYWTDLFKLKGTAIYLAKTVDLEELVEHMEENLPHGTIYAYAVMKHLRTLLTKNRAGDFGLGLDGTDSLGNTIENPYSIVEESTETENRRILIASAPEKEPKQEEYPDLVSYLRAKAAYILAKAQIDRMAEAEAKATAQDSEAVLDGIEDVAEDQETAEEIESLLEQTNQGMLLRKDYTDI